MPVVPTLKIKKTIRVSHWKAWIAVATTCVVFVCGPCLTVLRFHHDTSSSYGPITDNLRQDVSKAYPLPKPFRSSWFEYPVLRSGLSHYSDTKSNMLNNMESFFILFSWSSFLTIAFKLLWHLLSTGEFMVNSRVIEVKLKQTRYAIFLIFCACYSFIIILAVDGAITLNHHYTKDITKWLESSIVHIGPKEMNMNLLDTQKEHPLTSGTSMPYYYQESFRYIGEDVQFICEYEVLGELGAKPIYESSWWTKNGERMSASDRNVINVTINLENECLTLDLCWFTVRNILTINMLGTDHYGKYACIYNDPLIWTIIKPVFQRFTQTKTRSKTSTRTTPDKYHDLKPRSLSESLHTNLDQRRLSRIYAEFSLKPRAPQKQSVTVKLNPGAILITEFHYVSQAEISDVSVDSSFSELSSSECCSPLAKIYWVFYRKGRFLNLPISRALWVYGYRVTFVFAKWMCVCKENIIQRQTGLIYRTLYNSTLKTYEIVEIHHPASIVINPGSNRSAPFVDTLGFCDETKSPLCDFLGAIFENQFFTVYGIDLTILFMSILYICFIFFFHFWCKVHINIPFRNICFYMFSDQPIPFEAVRGPQINRLQNHYPGAFENNETRYDEGENYDIYISYCQDNLFDRVVARHFKKILIEMGLTVFDSNLDVLPGHPIASEMFAAVHRSVRFVIFASDAFKKDFMKRLEFDAINDVIKSQGTKAKSRLLIVRFGSCEIDGLHRVPCIIIPDINREKFELEDYYIKRFREWEDATRPAGKKKSIVISFWKQLSLFGLNRKSVVCFLCLAFLAQHSFIFAPDEVQRC